MILADMHVHTSFSADSSTPPELQIQRAIELGMSYICITDHHDFDGPPIPPENLVFLLDGTGDATNYFAELNQLKEKYADQIEVLIGVELALQNFIGEKLDVFSNAYPFDFIIGSSHCLNGLEVGDLRVYAGRTYEDSCRQYFAEELRNISVFQNYDVVGHLDFIFRHLPGGVEKFKYEDYADTIDPLLQKIIQDGKGIECNTSSMSKGGPEPNPNRQILKRYVELGVKIITFGSDSHTPNRIGENFSVVKEMVKECGLTEYAVFKNRKPMFFPL